MTDEIAKEHGFYNAAEFFKLTSEVDMNTPEKIADFKWWQVQDGTKDGLLALAT